MGVRSVLYSPPEPQCSAEERRSRYLVQEVEKETGTEREGKRESRHAHASDINKLSHTSLSRK